MAARLLICLFLLALAGAANGVMDTLQFHYSASVFPRGEDETLLGRDRQFWDPDQSWRNKYREWPHDKRPAFVGATTYFVFLTDGWHLAQMIMLTAFQLGLLLPLGWRYRWRWWHLVLGLLVAKVVFGGAFQLLYSHWLLLA